MRSGSTYACACRPGFSGLRCSTANACALVPCKNGQPCVVVEEMGDVESGSGSGSWMMAEAHADPGTAEFTCECSPPWSGGRCERHAVDGYCHGSPCQNHGECVDGDDGYECRCPPEAVSGFGGPNCDLDVDECASGPCKNGGVCRELPPTPGRTKHEWSVSLPGTVENLLYRCECEPPYGGTNCNYDTDNQCTPSHCQNGGICVDDVGSAHCDCTMTNFGGPHCSEPLGGRGGRHCSFAAPVGSMGEYSDTEDGVVGNNAFCCQSRLSCSRLRSLFGSNGWPQNDMAWKTGSYGTRDVCGGSELPGAESCLEAQTFAEAQRACDVFGARLCTLNEIESDEARATGCGFDRQKVWTSNVCGRENHMVSVGAETDNGIFTETARAKRECAADDQLFAVRCCADAQTPTDRRQTCHAHMESSVTVATEAVCGNAVFGQADVCGISQTLSTRCTSRTYLAAHEICIRNGARLCSLNELQAAETRSSGCSFDVQRVWSNTKCSGGHMSMAGSPVRWNSHPPRCNSDATVLAVRCCVDSTVGQVYEPSCTSRASCNALEWPADARYSHINGILHADYGDTEYICSASKIPECREETWAVAKQSCEHLGARLCTLTEVV
jgi:hypothetical protein